MITFYVSGSATIDTVDESPCHQLTDPPTQTDLDCSWTQPDTFLPCAGTSDVTVPDTVSEDSNTGSYIDSSDTDSDNYGSDSSASGVDSSDGSTSAEASFDGEIKQLSEREMQALTLLSCFIRHNMSASACKDVIKTFQSMFPDSAGVQELDYTDMWKYVSSGGEEMTEVHYCSLCCEVFPDDEDIYRCTTAGCAGLRYKGTLQSQTGTGRQPRQRFVFADIRKQLQLLMESPGMLNFKNTSQFKTLS